MPDDFGARTSATPISSASINPVRRLAVESARRDRSDRAPIDAGRRECSCGDDLLSPFVHAPAVPASKLASSARSASMSSTRAARNFRFVDRLLRDCGGGARVVDGGERFVQLRPQPLKASIGCSAPAFKLFKALDDAIGGEAAEHVRQPNKLRCIFWRKRFSHAKTMGASLACRNTRVLGFGESGEFVRFRRAPRAGNT